MERFSFTSQVAFVPRGDQLDRVTVAPLTASSEEGSPMQVAVFRFEPGGRLRGHPGHPQIFAILDGSGEVSGANGNVEPIEAGEDDVIAPGRGTCDDVSGWIDGAHHPGRTSGSFPRAPDGCSFALNCGCLGHYLDTAKQRCWPT